MKPFLDRFILNVPRLFIKQFPYAWFPLVVLWSWPPNFSIVFLGIILLGLLLLAWQSAAWISHMRREHAPGDGKFYVDAPAIPWGRAVRNIAILLAGSGLVSYLLIGQFGLNFWQFFIIIVGFTLSYRDSQFFGFPTVYIITATGIAVYFAPGHLDYRLFLTFREISRIEQTRFKKDEGWDFFARTRDSSDGLLLIPKDPNGFSKRLKRLFIVPGDIEGFVEHLPYGFK
ncbi:MAG: hypothetical protein C3F07_04085 [Anaerolineales bacterium]|nr:hypothetical protein [Anaerolineae bacterium]PWB76004.1 MAG: hypothetical protein C3F07_04085 [Anaerolineales bacterium]